MPKYKRQKTQSEFGKLLKSRFVRIKLEDAEGVVRKEYAGALQKFQNTRFLFPDDICRSMPLYDGARVTIDWFGKGAVIIPPLRDGHIYARRLKPTETLNTPFASGQEYAPRFAYAVVAREMGVPTPQAIAYLRSPKGNIQVAEFVGSQNLHSAIRAGLRRQNQEKEKALAKKIMDAWECANSILQKYSWLPKAREFAEACGMDTESFVLFEREFSKRTGISAPTDWMLAASCIASRADMRAAVEEDANLYEACCGISRVIHRILLLTPRHKPEQIYRVAERIGQGLRRSNNAGFLLLDVAPRDIVIDDRLQPWFADMENVEYKARLAPADRERQLKVFREEMFANKDLVKAAQRHGYDLERVMDNVERGYRS